MCSINANALALLLRLGWVFVRGLFPSRTSCKAVVAAVTCVCVSLNTDQHLHGTMDSNPEPMMNLIAKARNLLAPNHWLSSELDKLTFKLLQTMMGSPSPERGLLALEQAQCFLQRRITWIRAVVDFPLLCQSYNLEHYADLVISKGTQSGGREGALAIRKEALDWLRQSFEMMQKLLRPHHMYYQAIDRKYKRILEMPENPEVKHDTGRSAGRRAGE